VKEGRRKIKVPSPPTWSWASFSGAISYFGVHHPLHDLCVITDTECTAVDELNPKGEITQGRLVISGQLQEARLKYFHGENGIETFQLQYAGQAAGDAKFLIEFEPDYLLSVQGLDHVVNGERVFCLTIGIYWHWLYAMVLLCIHEEGQTYKRIGIVRHYTGIVDPEYCSLQAWIPGWELQGARGSDGESDGDTNMNEDDSSSFSLGQRGAPYYVTMEKGGTSATLTDLIESLGLADSGRINFVSAFENDVRQRFLATLTPTQADEIAIHPVVHAVAEIPVTTRTGWREGDWFLTAHHAKRKDQGMRYFRYLGKTITIV